MAEFNSNPLRSKALRKSTKITPGTSILTARSCVEKARKTCTEKGRDPYGKSVKTRRKPLSDNKLYLQIGKTDTQWQANNALARNHESHIGNRPCLLQIGTDASTRLRKIEHIPIYKPILPAHAMGGGRPCLLETGVDIDLYMVYNVQNPDTFPEVRIV